MIQLTPSQIDLAKSIADVVWSTHDNTYGYVTEKMAENDRIPNHHPDNMWAVWGQFDSLRQTLFMDYLSQVTQTDDRRAVVNWCVAARQEEFDQINKLRGPSEED